MLAVLGPEAVIEHPDSGVFNLHGGHRLWAAPEIPSVTYASDDEPCHVSQAPGSVTVSGPADGVGLAKEITVRLGGERLVVGHRLRYTGEEEIEVAPWAITQLPLGGQAILPLGGDPSPHGLTATRSLVLWPYTEITDSRLSWRENAVVVETAAGPPLKIGSGPRPVRLGYLRQGFLFIKTVPPARGEQLPDRGAVAQVYVNEVFCELESLGPLTRLGPGETVGHEESWAVERCDGLDTALERVTEGVRS
jgi:hypothetical protein